MNERTRRILGWAGLGVGLFLVLFGSLAAHFTRLPELDTLGREIYPWIPRGCTDGLLCTPVPNWVLFTSGQLVAVVGSQIAIGAVVLAWLWDRTMTWTRATVGAFLFTAEMVILLGIVPGEILNLTQTEFEWTAQKIWFTIPEWLVLNNTVEISFGSVKDLIVLGYVSTVFAAVIIGMYQVQERKKRAAVAPKPQPVSVYGRPLVKGSR